MTERGISHVILRHFMQITQTETDNQTDHNNMKLFILFCSNRCSTLSPPQGNRQVTRVTTLITVACMIPLMAATVIGMAFYSSISVDGKPQYTRDYK